VAVQTATCCDLCSRVRVLPLPGEAERHRVALRRHPLEGDEVPTVRFHLGAVGQVELQPAVVPAPPAEPEPTAGRRKQRWWQFWK